MSSITVSDLKARVSEINDLLLESGSNIFFMLKPRNGTQAVDSYYIDVKGSTKCIGNIEIGSSRCCIIALNSIYLDRLGDIYHGSELSRKSAKVILSRVIDFRCDYHKLDTNKQLILIMWANLIKYNKPVLHSKAYGFFNHLSKRVK